MFILLFSSFYKTSSKTCEISLEVKYIQSKHNGLMVQVECFVEKSQYFIYIKYSMFDEAFLAEC